MKLFKKNKQGKANQTKIFDRKYLGIWENYLFIRQTTYLSILSCSGRLFTRLMDKTVGFIEQTPNTLEK